MIRRLTTSRPGLALLALGLLGTGCATTSTVVPGRTMTLIDVQYPESRMSGVVLAPGEETPTNRFARALVREVSNEGFYKITDARNLGVRPGDLGKDAAKTGALVQSAPADAYLGVRLLDCAARPTSATETRGSGPSAVTVTLYWFAGECTAELTAFDAEGKTIKVLQKSGRWESSRQERPDSSSMQSQVLTNAVDDTARRIAREIRPSAEEKK